MDDSAGHGALHPEDTPLRRTQAMADGVLRTVQIAAALVASGRRVDLQGIDDLVGRLCARALDLPPEQGAMLTETLRRVLREADALHAQLSWRGCPPPLPM